MKIIAKIILIIAAFLAGMYVSTLPALSPSNGLFQATEQKTASVSMMIDYGDGTLNTFQDIGVTASSTVFAALKNITAEAKIDFKYTDYGELGVMVEKIGGKANNLKADRFWQFWVNNKYSTVGASAYRLTPGDVVEWKYTKGQFTE